MGQPEGDLSQSPGKSCTLNVSNETRTHTHVNSQSSAISTSGGVKISNDNKIKIYEHDSPPIHQNVDQEKVAIKERKSDPHHNHQLQGQQYPIAQSGDGSDTGKNISEESGLSSSGDVSSSLSSSESFSGSEDISPKSTSEEKEVLTSERSSVVEPRCQEGIDVIRKQQGKLDGVVADVEKENEGYYKLDGSTTGNGRDVDDNGDDDRNGDQHVLGNEETVERKRRNEKPGYCDTTAFVDESVEISCSSTRVTTRIVNNTKENAIMMETMMIANVGEEEQGKLYDKVEKASGKVMVVAAEEEKNCQAELSHPSGGTDGKKGNHAENIWTFPSSELSSSSSPLSTVPVELADVELSKKQQNHEQNQNNYRDSRPLVREKKPRVFGLSGLGCRFNLNKIFSSSSSSSSPSSSATQGRNTTTHLSTEILNNQLSTFPSATSQGAVQSLALGTATTLLSNVSKSSSESNILMCHNSLDNLTDELPSSRSTDSSCLLPTTAVDDQVLDNHHHHHFHNHRTHQENDALLQNQECCCYCSCCCCKSNGTCNHLRNGQSRKCNSNNNSSRCSSSPATIGRRQQQQKTGNANSDGKDGEEMEGKEEYVDQESVSLLEEETNNNNHRIVVENRSNHFTDGNNSNSLEGGRSSCNPSSCSGSSSQSSSSLSTERVKVLRTRVSGGDERDMTEEMEETTACGSSASHSGNRNQNGHHHACCVDHDSVGSCCSVNNCTGGRRNSSGCATTKTASDPTKRNETVMMTTNTTVVGPSFVNSLGKNSATCSSTSSSSSSSSASPSCSTTGHDNCTSGGGSSGESKESASSGNSGGGAGSCNSSSIAPNSSLPGQKFKLLSDGDVQVCRVKHGKNLVDKVIGSKLLRRWETHHLYLNDACISSKTVSLFFTILLYPLSYVYKLVFTTFLCRKKGKESGEICKLFACYAASMNSTNERIIIYGDGDMYINR